MPFWSTKSENGPGPQAPPTDRAPARSDGVEHEPVAGGDAELRRQVAKSKQRYASFGEITSVLMRIPQLKEKPISTLEALVVPAVATGQFMIAETQAKEDGSITPVAAILWASVSDEVDGRLSARSDGPVTLAPKEWESGDIPWLILAVGDKRLVEALTQKAQETALKGRPLKSRVAAGGDGSAPAVTTPLN